MATVSAIVYFKWTAPVPLKNDARVAPILIWKVADSNRITPVILSFSQGGIPSKMVGRVGDSPLVGCGGYANEFGGCSTTGHGESLMKMTLAREVVYNIERGDNAQVSVMFDLGLPAVLPLARKVSCKRKFWPFQGKMQGNKIYKEMAWKFELREGN